MSLLNPRSVLALLLASAACTACATRPSSIASDALSPQPAQRAQADGMPQDQWPAAEPAAAPNPPAEGALGAQREARADYSTKSAEADYEERASEQAPARRPGLATRWGERRESAIQEVGFVRDDPRHPFAVLAFNYDDEKGVSWKTGRDPDDALPSVFSVRGGAIEVSLVSASDEPLPQLQARGRTYIVGDEDERYSIRLTNFTRDRYEVVASVDGLDVLSGTEANYTQRGYVLAPWSTLHIEGFRDSSDSVRAFRFGDVEESYAIGRGYGRDIGVIGVALFAEERTRPADADGPSPFPGEFAPPPRY